ncbi:MAG: glycerol-3-phosphate 1-O-acyltransferase PlsY [Lentisphaeria bacterium]|nr:glycerol-3-phosphate 1-O-acyltransferase PlsY [Lentisphaeria bacterium]
MDINTVLLFTGMILAAYLTGAIPFGFLIGKLNGKDIRKEGSCNIGATNVTRVVGKWWGKLCFLCDFLKGFLPVFLVMLLYPADGWLIALTALATMLGHIFPVYLRFKGGKGVSTAAGAALALCPPAVGIAGVIWVLVFFLSRYVSLASLAAALALPLSAWLLKIFAGFAMSLPAGILLILFAVLAFWRHRSNIVRLMNGTESRFEKAKRKAN